MDREQQPDGRHARRERSRQAVIEAMFELVQDGKGPPEVDAVAERAGISVSSIFRMFDGLADLQYQALDRFQAKFDIHFLVDDAHRALSDRIRSHVRVRTQLHEETGELLRLARGRAIEHQPMVEGISNFRGRMARQTRERFANEIRQLTPAEAANLAALIDSMTSLEAFEVMAAAHARTSRQVSRSWIAALETLLAPFADEEAEKETRS